jgi:hypothetical protein
MGRGDLCDAILHHGLVSDGSQKRGGRRKAEQAFDQLTDAVRNRTEYDHMKSWNRRWLGRRGWLAGWL